MKKIYYLLVLLLLTPNVFSQYLKHNLDVTLNISKNEINCSDKIVLSADMLLTNLPIEFVLNNNLIPEITAGNYILSKSENQKNDSSSAVQEIKYNLTPTSKKAGNNVTIKYQGIINDKIVSGAAEYARGFSETSGIIAEKGIYLAGSSVWIPTFNNQKLFTFTLLVNIDKEWSVVSQGERTINKTEGDIKKTQYDSPNPVDEIYLIAAKWTEYSKMSGGVLVQAFLRTPDEALANKYIRVTSGFIKMDEKMIGPYPYKKFALVENFWETGYGMPSFTLLGEKIIRFPWILYSSYPHELLHNYWGNSVFVDYEAGNWCEGITAYMADHLMKEQRGQGKEYRRSTLQKFADYVNEENDFPVLDFRNRHNSAEEAIGYGKVLMINNMLRDKLGDSIFLESYRYFYKNYKFKITTFNDIRKSFEAVSGKELKEFFNQWLTRKGAPTLSLENVVVKNENNKYNLSFEIKQIQKEDVFNLEIPVAIFLENSDKVIWKRLKSNKQTTKYFFVFDSRPAKVEIDPQFNLFRRLDRNEVPTSLSQIYGETDGVIIIPTNDELSSDYLKLANTWKKTQEAQGKTLQIINDSETEMLPADVAVWVLGKKNKFAKKISIPEKYLSLLPDGIPEKIKTLKDTASLVYAIPNPKNKQFTIGFISCNNADAINGLNRKLPHYGKYGYLGFTGQNPDNVLKGSFPAIDSPLNFIIKYNGEILKTEAKIKSRKALSYIE